MAQVRRRRLKRNPAAVTKKKKTVAKKKAAAKKKVAAKKKKKKAAAKSKPRAKKKTVAKAKAKAKKKSTAKAKPKAKKKSTAKAKPKAKKKAAAKAKPKAKKRKKAAAKKKTGAKAKRRGRPATGQYGAAASLTRRTQGKGGGTSRSIARTYSRAVNISHRAKSGKLSAANTKLAQAWGLTKINPSIKAALKDVKVMLPTIGVVGASVIGAATLGQQIGVKILAKAQAMKKRNEMLERAIVPATTLGISTAAYLLLKTSKTMQKWAMPVMIGGGAAALVHLVIWSKSGQKLAQKVLGGPLSITSPLTSAPTQEKVATEGGAAAAKEVAEKLEGYMTVSRYMGDYVDSGPQNQFGDYGAAYPPGGYDGYVASDFPVHSPGPGDNSFVMATLGDYGDGMPIDPQGASWYGRGDINALGAYGQDGIFSGGLDYDLEETPGGTVITMGEAGIFGGKSAI